MPLERIDGMHLSLPPKVHCIGWHAVNDVCEKAGVSVNATQNRHRASTLYAGLDMSESDRRVFFSHLEHV